MPEIYGHLLITLHVQLYCRCRRNYCSVVVVQSNVRSWSVNPSKFWHFVCKYEKAGRLFSREHQIYIYFRCYQRHKEQFSLRSLTHADEPFAKTSIKKTLIMMGLWFYGITGSGRDSHFGTTNLSPSYDKFLRQTENAFTYGSHLCGFFLLHLLPRTVIVTLEKQFWKFRSRIHPS